MRLLQNNSRSITSIAGTLLAATGLLGLLLLLVSTARAQKNDWLIVPGSRVGPITATTTRSDLDSLFGRENVRDHDIDLAEGPLPAAVVFEDDPAASLGITWEKEHPSQIYICFKAGEGPCKWRTASGIRLGLPLRELERLNGRSFQLAGFGFDGQGMVTSWRHGHLEEDPAACGHLGVRLADLDDRPKSKQEAKLWKQASGDKPYASDSLVIDELQLAVGQLIMSFTGPGCAAK